MIIEKSDVLNAVCHSNDLYNPAPRVYGIMNGERFALYGATNGKYSPNFPDGSVSIGTEDRKRFLSNLHNAQIKHILTMRRWTARDYRQYNTFYVPLISFDSFTTDAPDVTSITSQS